MRILGALAVSLLVGVQDPSPKRPAFGEVRRLLPAYFASVGAQREKILDRMREVGNLDKIAMTKAEAQWVEKLALAGNPGLNARKSGEYTIDLDAGGKKAALHVHVPGGYKPAVPAPLVVALHGGSGETATYEGSRKVAREELGYWSPACDTTRAICVAPSTTGFWSAKAGLDAIWKAIDHARENFNVDSNRIAVAGHSMGGFGIFEICPDYADRFALAAPFVGGADATAKLKNCGALPFYIVIGARDPMKYINDACRKNADFLKELGYDVTFKEHADKGHDPIESEFPGVLSKLAKSPRNLYPRRLARVAGTGRFYWLDGAGRLEAEVKGQTIETTGPFQITVYLSDRLVDLDQPVKVVHNGQVLFEGRIERSLGFMLQHLQQTGDSGRLFVARIQL